MALSDYKYYKKITFDSSKIDSDLSHFPVAIPLGSTVGLTDEDVTDIFDEVGTDYLKIAVFQDDEETELYVEVEQWDDSAEKGLLWVSRDGWTIASDSDTDIYLAFDANASDNTAYVGTPGNRTEVWNSDFSLRYSLSQDPSGDGTDAITDSTSNANHGTPTGLTQADSIIGLGVDVDAESDKIELQSTIENSGVFEFEALLYMRTLSDDTALFGADDYNDGRVSFRNGDSTIAVTTYSNNTTDISFSPAFPVNEWALLSIYRDLSDQIYILVDGVDVGNGSRSGGLDFSRLFDSPDNSGWNGMDDAVVGEVRFYSALQGGVWRKASSYALTDNLLTFGATQVGSTYEISGTVSEDEAPVERTVRLYRRSTGELVGETTSDYEDGSFLLETTHLDEHYVVALDDTSDATDYNALIYDRVIGVEASS